MAPRKRAIEFGGVLVIDDLHKLAAKYFEYYRGFAWPEQGEDSESRAKVRRDAGRYTLEEAAFFIAKYGKASAKSMMRRIEEAVADGTLRVFRPGLNSVHKSNIMRPWDDEAYWDDLNSWLEKNERHIGPIFPSPANAQGTREVEGKPAATSASTTTVNLCRRNTLDPLIDEAIKRAKCLELADVYNELKKMAIDGAYPFKGTFRGSAIWYTDQNNVDVAFSRKSLGKRLARRREGRL
jgi:hypothetical protein